MRYQGFLYRALNPVWAREPLSGEGARRHGGRFNAKSQPALYTSVSIQTAIREANQVGALQPTTLVCYQADLDRIFDAENIGLLKDYDFTPVELAANDWRIRMRHDGPSPTQTLSKRLIADGYTGIRVRSLASGATGTDMNMVLWKWGDILPVKLQLIDDEGRLA